MDLFLQWSFNLLDSIFYTLSILNFKMKYSTSKQKLSQMHEALDRELEMVNGNSRGSVNSRKDREQFRYIPPADENKKITIPYKPATFDHNIKQTDIKNKKNQISQLQRKLQELQKKMDNISVSSNESEQNIRQVNKKDKNSLRFKDKSEHGPNEDTARFLINQNRQKQRQRKSNLKLSYPSLQDQEQDEQEQDSEEYFQIQKAIDKRKNQEKQKNVFRATNKMNELSLEIKKTSTSQQRKTKPQETDRKISHQSESGLQPKYTNGKSVKIIKDKQSQDKKSIRDSLISKKSVEKPKQIQRTNSKRSMNSNSNSVCKSQSKNKSKQRLQRSFDRFSQKNEQYFLHNEQVDLAKDLKKMSNLQKQVLHYKRLSAKYKERLEGFRIMEIEFKQLKQNFAKSQLIRTQQKKIISNLKQKLGNK